LGARFVSALEEATTLAITFPLAGSPASKNTRKVLLKDFPFSVVYRADDQGIIIFAIAHHSRRPGYWQARVLPSS